MKNLQKRLNKCNKINNILGIIEIIALIAFTFILAYIHFDIASLIATLI